MTAELRPAAGKHSVPVIDRMMEVLGELERRAEGATITTLTAQLAQPRSTVYRILNTLQRHDMVRRDRSGSYFLGARLVSLAGHVVTGAAGADLPKLAQPVLNRLAEMLGEGVKLSVVDPQGLLVIAVAQGRREYALTVRSGQRIPLHVGAAGKVLLAHMPDVERQRRLDGGLQALTESTLTDADRLGRELARIRTDGWARDRGEQVASIHAVAVPVWGAAGAVVAAISVPFLAGTSEERVAEIRAAAAIAATRLSQRLSEA